MDGDVRVAVADMDPSMQSEILEEVKLLYGGLDKASKEKDVAGLVREWLDDKYGKSWNVIVGASFGSSVSSLAQRFLYFYVGSMAFLIFQTK